MAKSETRQIMQTFSDDVENEVVVLDEKQFEKLVNVLSIIDKVRDSIDELADNKSGVEITMFKLSYELGKSYSDLCNAYDILDSVTDELNPAHAMDDDREDD